MARLWGSGFELQSVTSGVEWDTATGSPTISTAVKRSGGASLRTNPTATTAFLKHQYRTSAAGVIFARFYLNIASAPSSGSTRICVLQDNSLSMPSIRLTSARRLQLWDEDTVVQKGSDSSVLSTSTWYRIELSYNAGTIDAYLDGTQFATGTMYAGAWINSISLGCVTSTTADLYFDDLAINDNVGTVQNSLPGAGSIVHVKPDSVGDANGWSVGAGGTAGTANNFTRV